MKKFILPIAIAFLALAGCSSDEPGTSDRPVVEPSSTKPKEYRPMQLSADQRNVADKTNNFAWRFLYQALQDGELTATNPNVILSPLSLEMNLSMVANGAKGDTRTEMIEALGFGDVSIESVNSFNHDLAEHLRTVDNTTIVALANAIWHRKDIVFKDSYKSNMSKVYNAPIKSFTSARGLADDVNAWCSKNTYGMIKELLDPDKISDDLAALLVNATYFKGIWSQSNEFDENDTKPMPFTNADGSVSDVPFMSTMLTGHFRHYKYSDYAEMTTIYYGNGAYCMNLILPADGKTTADCVAELAVNGLDDFRNLEIDYTNPMAFHDYDVDLKLPKFEADTDCNLNNVMSKMGINKAFTTEADFSEMCSGGLLISKIRQKSKLIINEKGTEVASVTSTEMDCFAALGTDGIIHITYDRPFIFAITEKSTGCILFVGKVEKL